MKRYIPKKGDRVSADGKNGPFTILKVHARRAVADLALMGKVAGKRHIVKGVPLAHIHPLNDSEDVNQIVARIVKQVTS